MPADDESDSTRAGPAEGVQPARPKGSAGNLDPTRSAAAADGAADLPEPPQIPDFELVRPIGRGGFGVVWLARTKTGVYRAVKVVGRGEVSEVEFEGIRTFEVHSRGHA
ncbi:MAG: hypothetical protein D6729_08290, partial [Deltaproteobacteria bacterium]